MDRAGVDAFDRVEQIMGMPIGIDVRDANLDPALLDRAFDWFRVVDAIFSTYKPESDISRLNRGEITLAEAHPDVKTILDRCERLRFETGGYFDIRALPLPPEGSPPSADRLPRTVDPSGLVKGWAVDRAAAILDDGGARNYAVNAGGDVRVRGGALPDPVWRIGIRHPLEPMKVASVVAATDIAVATSGAYERGHHIVDPHSGEAPSAILSVTIVGPELATADAYATAVYAMGEEGPEWAAGLVSHGYESMTITAGHTVLSTPDFPAV